MARRSICSLKGFPFHDRWYVAAPLRIIILVFFFRSVKTLTGVFSRKLRGSETYPAELESHSVDFSSHRCFGSRRETRSCIFTNLYFDVVSNKFEYYLPSVENMAPLSFDEGRPQYNFSILSTREQEGKGKRQKRGGFLFLHAGGRRGKSNRDRTWYEPWEAEIYFKNLPKFNSTKSIADTTILWESISPGSFGHLLVDNIIPIFIIAKTFDISVESLQIVVMASCIERYNVTKHFAALAWCENLMGSGGIMSPGLSSKKVKSMRELIQETIVAGKKKILLHRVVLGGGGLAMWLHLQESNYHEKYADPGKRDSRGYGIYFRELQQHLYTQFKIKEHSLSAVPSVVILDKKGGKGGDSSHGERRILNIDEVLGWIQDEFPGIQIKKVNFQPLSWASQLRILSETTILISPFGSVGFRALFLRKGAQAIILGLPSNNKRLTNWESDAWLRYQAYVGILSYPLDDEEIIATSKDPKLLEESNVVLTRSKICNLIQQAMNQHSQY